MTTSKFCLRVQYQRFQFNAGNRAGIEFFPSTLLYTYITYAENLQKSVQLVLHQTEMEHFGKTAESGTHRYWVPEASKNMEIVISLH